MSRLRILGTEFDRVAMPDAIEWTSRQLAEGRRQWICTVNAAILMMLRDDPDLREFVEGAGMTVADGQPLIWYSRLGSAPLPERVTGVDLVEELCALAAREGRSVYLMGAKGETVDEVRRRLEERHEGLNIAGHDDGYFGVDEFEARADAIRLSGAEILIVAMGVPRQENFLREQWERLGVTIAIPVGGSFEVIAGQKKRAPVWVQRTGFEWLYRLLQEPGRLWRRYLVTNTQFLFGLLKEAARGQAGGVPVEAATPDREPASAELLKK